MSADSAPWRPVTGRCGEVVAYDRDLADGTVLRAVLRGFIRARPTEFEAPLYWRVVSPASSFASSMEAADRWAHEEGLR